MFLLNETATLETRYEMMFWIFQGLWIYLRKERNEGLTSKLEGAYSKWDFWSDDEKKSFLVETLQVNLKYKFWKWLQALGARGVLDLLSVRQTVGSVDAFPPSRETLLDAFVKPHCPRAKLTVGARALAKHHHRDDTTSWWGKCTGSKSCTSLPFYLWLPMLILSLSFLFLSLFFRWGWKEQACTATDLQDPRHCYLDQYTLLACRSVVAATFHFFSSPLSQHNLQVVEMRTTEGYGARWLLDGMEFRGFLEPQMEDGHAVGWRH